MRGHCTTHVLRDRQLAANHRANHPSRLFFRKYKNRAIKERRSCRLIPLPRFRFASRTRVHAFSRPNFPCPERQACSTNRNAARSSNRSVNGFFFFSFSKDPVYCTGVCIIFALIMQVGSSGRKYWPLIGRCHLNQMFGGSFSPRRSHTKDYTNAGLRPSAIFDSKGENEIAARVLYRMRVV